MQILSKEEFLEKKEDMISEIKSGKIFIYPTDTIYGMGCDATNRESVKKIREIKSRYQKPFSVIVPSKEWTKKNCYVNEKVEKWLDKLPGPYTLILELRNWNDAVSNEVNSGRDSLGIRIPDNWFAFIIERTNAPFVTTSVNSSGEKPISEIKELGESMKDKIDYIIDDGKLKGSPSKIVNLIGNKEDISER
jgi:L-threonylcarbamoyladenylate synthase